MPSQFGNGFPPAVHPITKELVQPSCLVAVWHPESGRAPQLALRPRFHPPLQDVVSAHVHVLARTPAVHNLNNSALFWFGERK